MLCEIVTDAGCCAIDKVLILVLMEYALREGTHKRNWRIRIGVLILVLMEYALRDCCWRPSPPQLYSLNPCFNGICSASEYQ